MSDVVAIVQARLGSSRLPGKTLEILFDKPLLGHILERIAAAKTIDHIVVATTTSGIDDALIPVARQFGADVYRGSENDVLDRFYQTSRKFGGSVIVRITADDPFKDPEVIDHAVNLRRDLGVDYCSNTLRPTFPEGIDIEVFSNSALERAQLQAGLQSEREHVTPYIWKRPTEFSIHNFSAPTDLSYFRWTIDYAADLEMARAVYRHLYPRKRIFLMDDILKLAKEKPDLFRNTQHVVRNEGYLKSITQE
jgi:spore coat polysaccharide biosynthesis protein SpsF